ncbi:MAG: T9SS type A sorting domain-containing protein [Ignavibacteria bacterium]|nr:T9SS type A sorting domain-containing protein [Ignavibacteria bacterium]
MNAPYQINTNSIGNFSSSATLDIINGTSYFRVYAYNTLSGLPNTFPVLYTNYQYRNSAMFKVNNTNYISVYDYEQDSSRTKTRFFDKNGQESLSLPVFNYSTQVSSPVMCDLNKDGQLDFLITSMDFPGYDQCTVLNAFTMQGIPYIKENVYWELFGHDRYRTNQYGFVPPDEPVNIISNGNTIPSEYKLYQNYPNPFNPTTKIKFDIAKTGFTVLKIYDLIGREVQTIVNEELHTGVYEASFNGTQLTSGVYFYRLTSGEYLETKRMLLVK